ncbi:MAG: surface lipoprotein assembly modifier [Gammaproteobacteria bacterium]|nr:surface lipoprotein assembly modifier [Gammaproteobacteria bacterium]
MDSIKTAKTAPLLLLIVMFALPGLTIAEPVIEQLKSLTDQNQYAKAYQLATENRDQLEGDLEFDFLYGVAAIDTGHVNEGVFALERVVFSQPKNHLARLELARGYFLQGDDTRSRQAFERVLKVKPPESVVKIVNKFIAAIRVRESQYKSSSTAYVDIEVGSDSNVNAGPERNTLGIFENILSASSFANKDSYTNISFGGKYNRPLTPHSSMFLNADASIRNNMKETVNNNWQMTFQGGRQWQLEKMKYRLALVGQQYTLDGSTNRNMLGVNFEGSYATSKLKQYTFTANLMDMQHPDSAVYDSTQLTLGLSTFTKADKVTWYGGISTGLQSAKENSETAKSGADRTIFGANFGSLYSIDNRSSINVSIATDLSNYTGIYFGSTSKRKDTYSKLAVTYNRLINDQWKYRVGLNYSQNSSNVALLAYKRTQLLVGFQRVF